MDFSKVEQYLDSLHKVNIPGCDLVIYKDHEEIYRHTAGYADREKTRPVAGDETYCLYSCTKVFTTCAVMQLIEQGRIYLDDPVSKYLPEYKELTVKKGDGSAPAERTMTIRHLMSMQSGLSYEMDRPAIRSILEKNGGKASTRELVKVFPEEPLEFEPGTDFLYSLSHDVLAAVIEVVTGMSFGEYLRENIWKPLGLDTVGFVLKKEDKDRLAAQYEFLEESGTLTDLPDDVTEYRLAEGYESGGAGLLSNVKDYITFADTLACGGTSKDGVQILSPEMLQLWRANQLGHKSRASFDEWQRLGYSYALGVRTRVDNTTGGRGSIGEFGWDGAAGSYVMIDPYTHVSAFFAMHVKNYGYVYDVVHPTIRDLIYEGLEKE